MAKPQRSEIHMVAVMVCCLAATTFADKLPVQVVTIDEQPPERPYAKIAADFNGDGLPDIAIGGAKGPWTEHVYSTLWKHADAEVQCHDLNNDGRLDIVLTPAELKGDMYRISWFEAPENAKAPNWPEHIIEEVQETVVHALGVADINNDGKPDVVIAEMHQGADPDEVRVYLNQGGGLTWTMEVLSTTGSHDIILADIGADGDVDIVGANHAGSFQAVQLWENLTRTIEKGDR